MLERGLSKILSSRRNINVVDFDTSPLLKKNLEEHIINYEPVLKDIVGLNAKEQVDNVIKNYAGINLDLPRNHVYNALDDITMTPLEKAQFLKFSGQVEAHCDRISTGVSQFDSYDFIITFVGKKNIIKISDIVKPSSSYDQIDYISSINSIAGTISDRMVTHSLGSIIDLASLYQINPIIAGAVMEHTVIVFVGIAVFTESYVPIKYFYKDIMFKLRELRFVERYKHDNPQLSLNVDKALNFATLGLSIYFITKIKGISGLLYGCYEMFKSSRPGDLSAVGKYVGTLVGSFSSALMRELVSWGFMSGGDSYMSQLLRVINTILKK
jgi:hypothetical protein